MLLTKSPRVNAVLVDERVSIRRTLQLGSSGRALGRQLSGTVIAAAFRSGWFGATAIPSTHDARLAGEMPWYASQQAANPPNVAEPAAPALPSSDHTAALGRTTPQSTAATSVNNPTPQPIRTGPAFPSMPSPSETLFEPLSRESLGCLFTPN